MEKQLREEGSLESVEGDLEPVAGESIESGFTLIELMVVLLVMAILLAIAIPTFLGVKAGSQDRSVQSSLSNVLIAAKAVAYSQGGTYPSTLATNLSASEPELDFALASSDQRTIGVEWANGAAVLTAKSATGTCWYITTNDTGTAQTDPSGSIAVGIWYGSKASAGGACDPSAWSPVTNWSRDFPAS